MSIFSKLSAAALVVSACIGTASLASPILMETIVVDSFYDIEGQVIAVPTESLVTIREYEDIEAELNGSYDMTVGSNMRVLGFGVSNVNEPGTRPLNFNRYSNITISGNNRALVLNE